MGFGFIKKSGKKPAPAPPPPPPAAPEPKPEPKPEPAPAPPPPPVNGHPPCRCCTYDMVGDIDCMYGMHNLRSIEMSKNKTYRLNYWDDYNNHDDYYYYGTRQMGIYYPHNSHGYHRHQVFALPPPPRAHRRALPPPPHSHYPVPNYGHMATPQQCNYPLPLPPPRRHQFTLPPPPAYDHYAPNHHHHNDFYTSAVCYYY